MVNKEPYIPKGFRETHHGLPMIDEPLRFKEFPKRTIDEIAESRALAEKLMKDGIVTLDRPDPLTTSAEEFSEKSKILANATLGGVITDLDWAQIGDEQLFRQYGESPAEFRKRLNEKVDDNWRKYHEGVKTRLFQEKEEKLVATLNGIHPPVNDKINHPSHYKGVEVIDITEQLNFNRGNAVKYIARAGFKDEGTEVQDLQKALWYVEREIDRNVATPTPVTSKLVEKLVEQMNYHRGTAVWLISLAGELGSRNGIINDLTEATYSIKAEIERLGQYEEEL
jgi:hypothetical protein